MTACWTRNQCIWHYTEWRLVGLVISVSDIQNDGTFDSWSVYLILYRMTQCWLVICVSDIIQNDVGLVICVSDIIQNDAMLDSWTVYLTLYRMTACWTRNLCIWYYTEWRHVGRNLCMTLYRMMPCWLVIRVSDIIQNDGMLDSWSVYLTLYRMTACWTRDLCIWHYTEWRHVGLVICVSDIIQNGVMLDSWSVYLTLYRMTHVGLVICVSDIIQNDVGLVICGHYTEWIHVGIVICVSDIIQNGSMLDSWSVYLTLYRMTACWTRDLCIWHYTEWRHVGLVICVSDIIQNDGMLDS